MKYNVDVVMNSGVNPYRSCTMPEIYGPTAQPTFQLRLSTLFTNP